MTISGYRDYLQTMNIDTLRENISIIINEDIKDPEKKKELFVMLEKAILLIKDRKYDGCKELNRMFNKLEKEKHGGAKVRPQRKDQLTFEAADAERDGLCDWYLEGDYC